MPHKLYARGLKKEMSCQLGCDRSGKTSSPNRGRVVFGEVKMKKFLIAGSSLAAVAAAGSAGAVDVTLGGSIDMGVEFGLGKNQSDLSFGSAYNTISLSLGAAGTTDGGLKYGASFSLNTASELQLSGYDSNGTDVDGGKRLVKMTVAGATDLEAAVYNISGGQAIAASNIVGVKINSSWKSVGDTQTGYGLSLPDALGASNVCKIAGRVASTSWGTVNSVNGSSGPIIPFLSRQTADGASAGSVLLPSSTAYLQAGKLYQGFSITLPGPISITQLDAVPSAVVLTAAANDGFPIAVNYQPILLETPATGSTTVFGSLSAVVAIAFSPGNTVSNASGYAGPFAEVKLQSSSTKMVVGAVCVEGVSSSDTNYFLNNASKIVTASDASVFIEGGFGKLTLQTGDYAGGVTAIGDAGDAADISADGLVAVLEGYGPLGANPYVAVDLHAGRALNANLEILTGGTIDLGGVSASVDVELGSDADPTDDPANVTPADFLGVAGWDLGLSYALGDMAVNAAYDSQNDWGLSASMAIAGFSVDATVYNKANEDHKKNGLFYSASASTSLNDFALSIGVDQDMQPTVGLSRSMGGLNLYASYDAADEGGKVGATLSF